MHLIQEALYQQTGLCETYRLTHCWDIFYRFSEGDLIFSQVSWISLIKLPNMRSIQSGFSLSPIILAYLFECTCESLFKTCNINLLDDLPLKKNYLEFQF